MSHPFLRLLAAAAVVCPVLFAAPSVRGFEGGTVDLSAAGSSGQWQPLGTGIDGGIHSLAVHDGQLIAVGAIEAAGGAPVQDVARWNGSTWSPLGGGLDNRVSRMYVVSFRDSIIVAGNFNQVGGAASQSLARWDGNQWSALPGNLFYQVDALAVYNNDLIVSGSSFFTGARKYIARWDGNAWSALGGGLEDTAFAMHVHGGKLYAFAGLPWPQPGDAIWNWDGSSWTVFENRINGGDVRVLGTYAGRLVAAGNFSSIGGVAANRIARWNGTTWEPLGSGLGIVPGNQSVRVLGEYNGQLWAAGNFQRAGGVAVDNIAVWNGLVWYATGSGATPSPDAFASYAGSFVVGGVFDAIDGVAVDSIAGWRVDAIFRGRFE